MRADGRQRPEKAASLGQYAQEIGESALQVSLREFLAFNSRCGGGVQTFPAVGFILVPNYAEHIMKSEAEFASKVGEFIVSRAELKLV